VTNKYSKLIRSGKPLETRLANDLCSQILSCNDFYTEDDDEYEDERGAASAYITETFGNNDAGFEF